VVGYSSVGIASSVFAQRSGAARNLSLWPFGGSKSENPKPTETAIESSAVTPPATEAQAPAVETNTSVATTNTSVSSPVANQQPDISQIPEDLLRELEPHSFVDIPERIGFLKELGLDFGWGPTACCEWLVEHIHVMSGLPWWGSIAVVAILFRAVMFYPTLNGSKHQARLQKVQATPAYIKAKADFEEAAFRTKDQAAMMYARAEMKRIMQSSGASFWRPFIGMAMFPFSIGMFRLIRGMASVPVPGLETGGLAWFTDLTVSDPLYILPCISVGLGVYMFKVRFILLISYLFRIQVYVSLTCR
jgi:YidC/Oxa1 family membrane protein insertase